MRSTALWYGASTSSTAKASDLYRQFFAMTTPSVPFSQPVREHEVSAAASESLPQEVFTLFPKLPLELRLMIWKWACFQRRDLHLGIHTRTLNPQPTWMGSPIGLNSFTSYFSRSRIPSILHTNHESRREALKWYKPDFGVRQKTERALFGIIPKICVNWHADRICLDDDWKADGLRELAYMLLARKVRYLVLNEYDSKTAYLLHHLLGASHLEEIILVFDRRPFPPDGNFGLTLRRFSYAPHRSYRSEIRKELVIRWPEMDLPSMPSQTSAPVGLFGPGPGLASPQLRWNAGGEAVPCTNGDHSLSLKLRQLWHNDFDTYKIAPAVPWVLTNEVPPVPQKRQPLNNNQ